jgi:hypothetical protein
VTEPVVWLGLGGCALAVTRLYERTVLPAAVAGLGLLAFLILGVTGLPLLSRYLLLPATLLVLWCAVAALGFTVPGAGRPWIGAAVIAFAVLAAALPTLRGDLRRVQDLVGDRAEVEQELGEILDEPAVRSGLARCGGALSVPDDRPYPVARILVPGPVTVRGAGVGLNYASAEARDAYRIGPAPPPGLPPGSHRLAANEAWLAASAAAACGR